MKEFLFDFDINEDLYTLPEIDQDDYISKSKKLLTKINDLYRECNKKRTVTDYERNIADCDNCTGECIINNIEYIADDEYGDCFTSYFDDKLFIEQMEDIIVNDDFYELICCEIKKKK